MCLYVCFCMCRLLQLLNDKLSESTKSFYRLLVTFSWIAITGFALRPRVMAIVLLSLKALQTLQTPV